MSDDVILSDEDMEETLKNLQDEGIEEIDDEAEDIPADDETEEEPADEALPEEPDDEPEEDDEPEFDQSDDEPEPEPESDDTVRPPSTWTAEAKSQWKAIPPRIKQEILKREEDIGRGISSYKQRADIGDRYSQVMQPYQAMIQAAGVAPEQAIQSVMNTMYRLQTGSPQEKAQLLLQTAQQYGADLEVLRQEPDPQQAQLQNYLSPLQNEIQQLRQQIGSQSQASEQAQLAEATNQIESFRNAADEKGNQLYPYFDNLREEMGTLIEARENKIRQQVSTQGFSNLKPMSLEEAYESAVWASPDTRSVMTAKQQTNNDMERARAAKQKLKDAKKVDRTNVKSKASRNGNKAKPVGNLDDTLRETLSEINSRSN